MSDYDHKNFRHTPNKGLFATKILDRAIKANMASLTGGITPAGVSTVIYEWLAHLAMSPGKQLELAQEMVYKSEYLLRHARQFNQGLESAPCIEADSHDSRFKGKAWSRWPYNLFYQSFLLQQEWWENASTNVDGLSKSTENVVSFIGRQMLDRWSPSNFPWLNPEVIDATLEQGGMNFVRGWENFCEDRERRMTGCPPVGSEDFKVGENLATTPGKVIYSNHLIELIQYTPTTEKVYAEPVLIVPAWIMKYYILDLTPEKSLVRYLLDQGHTVFMVSWRNVTSDDRELGMGSYRRLGPKAALDVVATILPDRKIHAVGYCLGGTLLTIQAATMARDNDHRLASLTLLAAQTDFTEAGELSLFITESEVDYLESMMQERGYLDGFQMAGAFQLLRTNDLIYSRVVREYMLGKRQKMNALMAWNADVTRMPYLMHSQYLRRLYLNNDLATGRYIVGDRPIAISDIDAPIFSVATSSDHVAPWRSVYKIHLLTDADEVTFLLTSGGHNAGIVSEPGHPRRTYQVETRQERASYIDPDTWQRSMPKQQGSWWPVWQTWLVERSSKEQIAPPAMGGEEYSPLTDAPGTYVLQK
ncbi:alpha/beta fold hydrolase [Pistricoccus aurantiacus]|uniref:Alpha/beta fold hydrolase n=1 Tax=Pistricoccus aurantiacus TaxID=1883414 RepID=A0A5B8SV15_9GAMM|nr:alpha/beta fold hydrolase [Pistricoccus aurantiacus]QEA40606.1 alpha/beta fold hydrolase [Pistricoccus aurantiacus]